MSKNLEKTVCVTVLSNSQQWMLSANALLHLIVFNLIEFERGFSIILWRLRARWTLLDVVRSISHTKSGCFSTCFIDSVIFYSFSNAFTRFPLFIYHLLLGPETGRFFRNRRCDFQQSNVAMLVCPECHLVPE